MLERWMNEGFSLLHLLLGKPEGATKTMILGLLALLIFGIVMRLTGRAAGMSDGGLGLILFAGILSLGLVFATAIASHIYILPKLDTPALRMAIRIGMPLIVLLLVGIPLMCAILRSHYAETLAGFIAGIIAALLSVMVVKSLAESVQGGAGEYRDIRLRTESVNEIIGR